MKRYKPHIQPWWTRTLFLLFLFSLPIAQAADLTFTPQTPIVEVGKKITLSVSGTSGEVTWTATKGRIQGEGTEVIYIAPYQVGSDAVTVLDEVGNAGTTDNVGTLKITVTSKQLVSPENANWEVFTNRSNIQALLLSDDGKTLWVGTNGGLEQWYANTRKLVRVFTNLDGLPSNGITALESDGRGGLWIGTYNGLAYHSVSGEWIIYNQENSGLPDNRVNVLLRDGSRGLWVGTQFSGLAYRSVNSKWTVYNQDNSGLSNLVFALESDGSGGLWIGTYEGLAYRSASGKWTVYNQDYSGLYIINAIESDSSSGLWIGTTMDGLSYRSISGEWTVYTKDNSALLDKFIFALLRDSSGGLWIGTGNGLVHHSINDEWTVYTKDNSALPDNNIFALLRDGSGGLWIGTGNGMGHRSINGEWTVYTADNSGLSGNYVKPLLRDGSSGLWIGTEGLAYHSVSGEWTVYSNDNSGLPDNNIFALLRDGSDGLWIGTYEGGLAYLSVSSKWTIYNKDNSGLSFNRVFALESDGSRGLWIGTDEGLTYRSAKGEWTVYTTDNSKLPHNKIRVIEYDRSGGVWIGTAYDGLVHRSVNGEWAVYTTDNSELPSNRVRVLLRDGRGGMWIGTTPQSNSIEFHFIYRRASEENNYIGGGLAYYSVNNEWTIYTEDNSELPSNRIYAIKNDDSEGVWIGTNNGLAYLSVSGEWTVYYDYNSGLPSNTIEALESDDSGGLWIGTARGLAHLTFTEKNTLCTDLNDAQCQTLLESNRAAVIIAGGGTDSTNTLWDTTAGISNQIYKMLNRRGFDNDEIYYLSPQSYADFNGDGLDDFIVDAPATPRNRIQSVDNPIPERPVTVDDVRQAFTWAKTGGHLDYPLYVFFVNHGGTDKFQLADNTYLDVTEFKAILDDYQNETGNQLVLVIDACYSGVLLEKLKAPNRAIISSTGNGLAYFDRGNKQGFSRFFSEGLLYGMSFHEAFGYATEEQNRLVRSLSIGQDQVPQFYDAQEGAWLKEIFINGDFTVGDLTLNVESLTTATTLTAGQPLNLQAKVTLAQGNIKRVWAILKPPKVNLVMDSNGTPILAFPSFNLYHTDNEEIWDTTWPDAVYNGEHEIVFYAEDNQANIANSEPIIITVNGGVDSPDQSKVQIVLEKDSYQAGELFKAELIEDLGWGYDLYAAVVFPDGNFLALKRPMIWPRLTKPNNGLDNGSNISQ
ncbi:two-component system sensor histidine kinase/response regulator [Beggiatoa sp. PS]|nr:two-component system sensor histidine kinase/response regulator [Beggiatoa sp. PS]